MMNTSPTSIWLRRYVITGGVVMGLALVWAIYGYDRVINTPMQGGWDSDRVREFAMNFSPYFLFVSLLLLPWWRWNRAVCRIGVTVFFLSGAIIMWALTWALWHGSGQVWILLVLLSVFTAHMLWLCYPSQPERIGV